MVKKLMNANKFKKDKTTYTRPEGAGNYDNMDDKNIVDQINIKIGTSDLTPTEDKHIVNKKYVDDLTDVKLIDNSIANTLHRHSELVASDGAPDPALSVNALGNVGIGTTNPNSYASYTGITLDDSLGSFIDFEVGTTLSGEITAEAGQFIITGQAANQDIQLIPGSGGDTLIITGNVGIGITSPSEKLDVNSDAIRIRTAQTPASATATGDAGMICWDASYIYVCTATNTWKRTALASW